MNGLVESQMVEFKQIWKDEYLKTICTLANSDGGATQSTEVPIEKFKENHVSKPFNPIIVNIFYKSTSKITTTQESTRGKIIILLKENGKYIKKYLMGIITRVGSTKAGHLVVLDDK